jgi:hypothetical protein
MLPYPGKFAAAGHGVLPTPTPGPSPRIRLVISGISFRSAVFISLFLAQNQPTVSAQVKGSLITLSGLTITGDRIVESNCAIAAACCIEKWGQIYLSFLLSKTKPTLQINPPTFLLR